MTRAQVAALGYVELGVSDLDAWHRYGQTVLGTSAELADGALTLRIDAARWRIRALPSAEDDLLCAGFEVADGRQLKALGEQLGQIGVDVSEDDPQPRAVDELLSCRDPQGLRIELFVGARRAPSPLRLAADVSGFVTDPLGLGHLVLSARDPEATLRFYQQGLGFLLSDNIRMGPADRPLELTFLHCNPRHHTLAVIPAPLPKRLHHLMLQVGTLDDVGRGLDRARAADISITSSLGKHTNDHMVSFYMRTPSGFDIEYGCGGREIDDATWQPEVYDATSFWGHQPAQA